MLYEILIIFVCMFASLGITELTVYIFNTQCSKKLPHKFYILADSLSKENAEYVIRFLEEAIRHSGLDSAVCGIKLGDNADVDEKVLEKLRYEYGNII